jgi:hypothetical protein
MAWPWATTSSYDHRSNARFIAVRSLSRNIGLMSEAKLSAAGSGGVGFSVVINVPPDWRWPSR